MFDFTKNVRSHFYPYRVGLNYVVLIIFFNLLTLPSLLGQVVLSADGSSNTYSLINSVLAPGYNAVEVPDCSHEEFGDHIDQVMDEELGKYVFRFHIHVTPDNDRCKNYDRQRNEIKTYDKSPDNLKAIEGEIVEYKWLFKLDEGFQTSSSFTHLHQVKAVGGSEEGMPLITLTARSTNKLQIRYAANLTQTTIKEVSLSPFLGQWVECTERVVFGESGSYKMEIKRMSDGVSVLSYENDDLRMWKTDADFLRPKWGIYRSLNDESSLRDEIIRFADFSIEELDATHLQPNLENQDMSIYPNPTGASFRIVAAPGAALDLYDLHGNILYSMTDVPIDEILNFSLKQGTYLVNLNYTYNVLSQKLIIQK